MEKLCIDEAKIYYTIGGNPCGWALHSIKLLHRVDSGCHSLVFYDVILWVRTHSRSPSPQEYIRRKNWAQKDLDGSVLFWVVILATNKDYNKENR